MTQPGPAVVVNINYGDGTPEVLARLTSMEALMATAAQQLAEHKTALSDFVADVTAKLDQLLAAQGELQPDAQVTFDEIKTALAAADAAIGDADNSDNPVPPVEPPV